MLSAALLRLPHTPNPSTALPRDSLTDTPQLHKALHTILAHRLPQCPAPLLYLPTTLHSAPPDPLYPVPQNTQPSPNPHCPETPYTDPSETHSLESCPSAALTDPIGK